MTEEINNTTVNSILACCKHITLKKNKNCLFTTISDVYYRENFHSDILAYYLSYDSVKEKFIDWINRYFKENKKDVIVDFYLYKRGPAPVREEGRRDITIYSNDEQHAIIIENKSNGANDMPYQIPRYYADLKSKGIDVDAIVYLNKQIPYNPLMTDWTEENIQSIFKSNCNIEQAKQTLKDIKKELVIATLAGDNGFNQNVIDYVLKDCKSVRECGLSLEIKDMFENIINGEYGMDEKDFKTLKEVLSKKDNMEAFINLNKIIPSLEGILRQDYATKLKPIFNNLQQHCGKLFVDFKKDYYMEIWFDAVLDNKITIAFALRKNTLYDSNPVKYKEELNKIKGFIPQEFGTGVYIDEGFIVFYTNPEDSIFDSDSFMEKMKSLKSSFDIHGLILK